MFDKSQQVRRLMAAGKWQKALDRLEFIYLEAMRDEQNRFASRSYLGGLKYVCLAALNRMDEAYDLASSLGDEYGDALKTTDAIIIRCQSNKLSKKDLNHLTKRARVFADEGSIDFFLVLAEMHRRVGNFMRMGQMLDGYLECATDFSCKPGPSYYALRMALYLANSEWDQGLLVARGLIKAGISIHVAQAWRKIFLSGKQGQAVRLERVVALQLTGVPMGPEGTSAPDNVVAVIPK